ncbi:transposase [Arthrobacter dokdonensis]|uniref:transposase n=1 Tax=Arthrobacter dokdonellae TaxID=2211210 RepID=UPI0014942302|nr:transposase [Arthrobacter dokdonellae]
MTTIVDLDTGQSWAWSMGGTTKACDWLFARPLDWRLASSLAIDPSAAFRKALRMWLPRTAVAVDHFHLVSLGNQAMTETRQNLSQQVKGRRGRTVDKAWAHRMLLLRAGDTLSDSAAHRLADVFAVDDPTGKLEAVWKSKNNCGTASHELPRRRSRRERRTPRPCSGRRAARNEQLYRTVCRWSNEIEVLIVTGATTGKVEANNTASNTSNAPAAATATQAITNQLFS